MMERGTITIENNTVMVKLAKGTVWLAQFEIAHLLGVFVSAVGSNVRAIYKSGALLQEDTMRRVDTVGGFVELYNLEMITALAFRLRSHQTQTFRRWILKRPQMPTLVMQIPDSPTRMN